METESKYDVLYRDFPEITKGFSGGFAIGDGWYVIIRALLAKITQYVKTHNASVAYRKQQLADGKVDSYPSDLLTEIEMPIIDQVKEKFGGLRFYFRGGDKQIRHWVEFAETMSYSMCEECGAHGMRRDNYGWLRTLCDEHAAAAEKQANAPVE